MQSKLGNRIGDSCAGILVVLLSFKRSRIDTRHCLESGNCILALVPEAVSHGSYCASIV
jgi:hypothetical protein